MNENEGYLLVLITARNMDEASTIADALVEERLAACVNVLGSCRSFYRWEGEIHRDDEVLMVVKSAPDVFDALTSRVEALHSYDVPEIIALELNPDRISPGYLAFLRDSLSS
jgi:periplasmic divalent cation tolerance protein